MQTLYLYIKDRTGIYLDSIVFHDILSQPHFVLIFDVHKLLLRLLVVGVDLEFVDLRQIGDPVVAHMSRHPVCKKRIRMQKETSLGDAVCLVVKLLRHHLIEVFQLLIL